jgi:hypothetical protein
MLIMRGAEEGPGDMSRFLYIFRRLFLTQWEAGDREVLEEVGKARAERAVLVLS